MSSTSSENPSDPITELVRNTLASCELEGIYLTEESKQELSLLTSGKMTPEEFKHYILKKYQQEP
ncbi:MAG: antitoxin VbhA family protein [Legionellales bacterium]|nr:antitoxin VbhA family protein [Legionellales bacterium]